MVQLYICWQTQGWIRPSVFFFFPSCFVLYIHSISGVFLFVPRNTRCHIAVTASSLEGRRRVVPLPLKS